MKASHLRVNHLDLKELLKMCKILEVGRMSIPRKEYFRALLKMPHIPKPNCKETILYPKLSAFSSSKINLTLA